MRHKFVDEVTIHIRSGDGGAGCVSFRRDKFIARGGPDGGDGGRGGDVIVRADPQLATLLDYKYRPRHIARNGQPGEGNQCSGAAGEEVVLRVPVGTIVHRVGDEEALADLDQPGAQIIVAVGGRGGKGNEHFKSSTRQSPRYSQPGETGQALDLRLELKLLADVGLVGFPNVGKSSLIARISAARPKVADYPFTTLTPNLGVVRFGGHNTFVVADVPGLIVDAHEGAGLGSRFLRHLTRVRRIAHLVTVEPDIPDRDPVADFDAIEREMRLHDERLADVPRILVLNRCDLDFVADATEKLKAFAAERGIPFFALSAATGDGTQALVNHLGEVISRERAEALDAQSTGEEP